MPADKSADKIFRTAGSQVDVLKQASAARAQEDFKTDVGVDTATMLVSANLG